jgi:hypothetical protein
MKSETFMTIVLVILILIGAYVGFMSEMDDNTKKIIILIIVILVLMIIFNWSSFVSKTRLSTLVSGKTEITVLSSEIETSKTNFSYSMWVYIDDWNYKYGSEKIILIRQDENGNSNPKIYLGNSTNDLTVDIQCYDNDNNNSPTLHECTVKNIKMQKWVHIVTVINNRTLDIYIDGKLVRTCLLPGVPKLDNEADIGITPDGGFSGFTSNVEFYNYVLNPQDVWDIYSRGYGGSLLGNVLGRYRAKLAFYEDNVETASLNF